MLIVVLVKGLLSCAIYQPCKSVFPVDISYVIFSFKIIVAKDLIVSNTLEQLHQIIRYTLSKNLIPLFLSLSQIDKKVLRPTLCGIVTVRDANISSENNILYFFTYAHYHVSGLSHRFVAYTSQMMVMVELLKCALSCDVCTWVVLLHH